MFPLGFAAPAVLLFLVALWVTARELVAAARARGERGVGPVITNTGEALVITGAIATFVQGWIAGLVLAPPAAFVLFLGGAALFFVGMSLESRRATRR